MARTKRQIRTVVVTFTAALGIGFLMQYGDALALRLGDATPVAGPAARDTVVEELIPVSASVAVPVVLNLPESREIAQSSTDYGNFPDDRAAPELMGLQLASVVEDPADQVPEADFLSEVALAAARIDDVIAEPEAPAPIEVADAEACGIDLTATPRQSAMVALDLSAPCRANMRVAFHHDGLIFHMMTDDAGRATVEVPALEADAFFIAAFDDAEGAIALAAVPEVVLFDRAVLRWEGDAALQVHALEFGAGYGEAGHIWQVAAGDRMETLLGQAGFLTRLGDPQVSGHQTEVYTYPSGMTGRQGNIALSVEVEVTQDTCGREISAQTLQVGPGHNGIAQDVSLTLPDCDAVGEFVVLKNALEDLTLASR